MTMVAEGVYTTRSVHERAPRMGIDMPITAEVYRVLYEGKSPREAVNDLMLRSPKGEKWPHERAAASRSRNGPSICQALADGPAGADPAQGRHRRGRRRLPASSTTASGSSRPTSTSRRPASSRRPGPAGQLAPGRPPAGADAADALRRGPGVYHVDDPVGKLWLAGLHVWSQETVEAFQLPVARGLFVLPVRMYRTDLEEFATRPITRAARAGSTGRDLPAPEAAGAERAGLRRHRQHHRPHPPANLPRVKGLLSSTHTPRTQTESLHPAALAVPFLSIFLLPWVLRDAACGLLAAPIWEMVSRMADSVRWVCSRFRKEGACSGSCRCPCAVVGKEKTRCQTYPHHSGLLP